MLAANLSIFPVKARKLDMTPRRAPAQSRTQAFAKPDGLEYCLDCWKSFMSGDPDRDLGMKTMRGLAGEGDSHGKGMDVYEAQQANDQKIGAATNAAISDLSRIHSWAIHRACSLTTVWNFPNADLAETAAEAKADLAKKLKNNSCTSILF